MSKNIIFHSNAIETYYTRSRCHWDDFYPSEQKIISDTFKTQGCFSNILDIGCAAGGLGYALYDQFSFDKYVGVDINRPAIEWAKKENKLGRKGLFYCDDILNCSKIDKNAFDTVFSLSVADWNIETFAMIQKSWSYVKLGGHLIISLRLSNQSGCNDLNRSFQYISFGEPITTATEIAPYVVFNIDDALEIFRTLTPTPNVINAYGYWGSPSQTAHTPYEQLVFAVFSIQKSKTETSPLILNLTLPITPSKF